MTKEEYLALASAQYDRIKQLDKDHDNFYDYEVGFEAIMIDLNRSILEKSLGELPVDRRKKKKLPPDMGK